MSGPSSVRYGWHFGATTRSARVGRFLLSETRYAAGLRTPWHTHEAAAFCLVQSGCYSQHFRSHTLLYKSSSVIYRPAEASHRDQVSALGAQCFIIEADSTWLTELGVRPMNRGFALNDTGTRARWLMEQALREFRSPDFASQLAVEGLLLSLAAELSRSTTSRRRGRHSAWLMRTRETLDAELAEHHSLSDLAAAAGVHPVHLAATFRAAFGMTVGEYVRARRISAAQEALGRSERSIADIALSLGFANQSHFTRVFRRLTGQTPHAFRREHADR